MINFAIRNCRVYFANKRVVLASVMGVLIGIAIYIMFLSNNIKSAYPNTNEVHFLINSWAMAGIIAVASITTTVSSLSFILKDRDNGAYKDFATSPVSQLQIAGGYILSSYIIGFVMCAITFLVAEIYVVADGGSLMSALDYLKIFGIILLTVISASSMMLFIISLFKRNDTFSNTRMLIGALSGFVVGLYIPIGLLPSAVQMFIQSIPMSHGAALLRGVMMKAPLTKTFGSNTTKLAHFNHDLGLQFTFGSTVETTAIHIAFMIISSVVFFALAVLIMNRKQSEV